MHDLRFPLALTALLLGSLSVGALNAQATEVDGQQIYADNCAGCHDGSGGPKRGAGSWKERLEEGKQTLYTNAIEGIRSMPARGGNPDLSDDEVKAAVDYLVAPRDDE